MSPRKHEVPDELLSRLLANYQKPDVDATTAMTHMPVHG